MSIPALPSVEPGEAERSVRALDTGPQRGDGGNRIAGFEQHRGQQTKQRQVQRLQNTKERERSPASPVPHAAVDFENELDPITDREPIDDARRTRRAENAIAAEVPAQSAISSGVSAMGASHGKPKPGKIKLG